MTWEGERGHRGWTCAHQPGQCPPAAPTRTARQGLFPALNSVPSSLESFLLLRDIKQPINFSFPLNNLQKAPGPTNLGSDLFYRKNKAIQLLLAVFIILDFFISSHVMWWFVKAVYIFFHSITSLFKRKHDYCTHLVKLFCCIYCFSYCNNTFSLNWNFIFNQKLIPERYLGLMKTGKVI